MKKLVPLFCAALLCLTLTAALAAAEPEAPEGYAYVDADGQMTADNTNGYQFISYKLLSASQPAFKSAAALGDVQAVVGVSTQPDALRLDGRYSVLHIGAKAFCQPTRAYALLENGRLIRLPFAAEDMGGYSMLHISLPDTCFDAQGFAAVVFIACDGEEFGFADAATLSAFKNAVAGSGVLSY